MIRPLKRKKFTMSAQAMNDRLVDHAVEVQEITGDDNLLKIVNNVETRLIQEIIQEKWKEHDEVKIRLKDFTIPAAGVLSILSAIAIMLNFNIETFVLGFVPAPLMTVGIIGVVVGGMESMFSPSEQRMFVKKEINAKRIELAEKMLNIEILKKENVKITEDWDEVMALDKNGDYVKILIRIVNDKETGLETIESKMLKNQ